MPEGMFEAKTLKMRKPRSLTLLLLAFTMFAASAFAQENSGAGVQPNTIHTSADGKFEAAPDTAVLQFSISAQEESAKSAYDRAQRQAQQLRDILRANGVDPASAELGFFSTQPVYDWRQPKRKLVGYRVTTNVSLKLKDFNKTGPIVQQIGDQEFGESVNLSYTLDNIDAAKLKAVEDAFQRARAEAATVARAGGRTLGELLYASVDTSSPIPIMAPMMQRMAAKAEMSEMAAPTAEFAPSKITVNARVTSVFTMK
jgi:uncharacterized protein YggE